MTRLHRPRRAAAAAVLSAAAGTALAGCQFTGLGSLPLPFSQGTGSGSYTITAQLNDVTGLPPHSEVMVHNVTVGTVTAITFKDWHANLVISLPDRVRLPANATVTVGQKSLLGAEYVALAPPANTAPKGALTDGAVIPLSRTSTYPSTEEVLATLSTVLNGGGLNQLSTINRELNDALAGHTSQVRDLLANLAFLSKTLDAQRNSIVAGIANMNQLTAQIRSRDATLTSAVDTIPAGLAVLDSDTGDLTTALSAVTNLSTVTNRVINGSRQNLLANLQDLRPAVSRLADSGQNLITALSVLPTFPFPISTVLGGIKGDYGNLFLTLDLTLPRLEQLWLSGSGPTGTPAAHTGNPLTAPFKISTPSSQNGSGSSPSPRASSSPSPAGGSGNGGLGGLVQGLTGGGNS